MKLTHSQCKALAILWRRHKDYQSHSNFATVFLGENTTALLRKLVPLWLVTATQGGSGRRQFFSITEAGRAAMEETS